jgi:hypothetical protein
MAGLATVALIVIVLVPFASSDPDGLERVAMDQGFLDAGERATFEILPDYTVPGLADATVSTIAAGLIGVVIVSVLMVGLGSFLARRRPRDGGEPS